jgi:hypothetical protein
MKRNWIIIDPKNNVYWERNQHYGYNFGNKPVFDARFTDDLTKATLMTKKSAKEVLAIFSEFEFIFGGLFKADAPSLIIKNVSFVAR